MRILVPLKQVSDPEHSARITITADGSSVETKHLEQKTNPFDEYALEAALRLTEDGRDPKKRLGEVIVATIGTVGTETMLRSALATGADRAIRIDGTDDAIDGRMTAKILAALVTRNDIDLVILGKQTVDGDGNEVAQRLAALLDWPQATGTGAILEQPDEQLHVEREVDGGVLNLSLAKPAVISVDLRIIAASSVRSRHTPEAHNYPSGVRFASLPAIMQSKRKPLDRLNVNELVGALEKRVSYSHYRPAQARQGATFVRSCDELIGVLATQAKVL